MIYVAKMKSLAVSRCADFLVALVSVDGKLVGSDITGPGGRKEMSMVPHWWQAELTVDIATNMREVFEKRARVRLELVD